MKKTILALSLLTSLNALSSACPKYLLVKKAAAKTAYLPTFESLNAKSIELLKSVGCTPEKKVMTKDELIGLLKFDFENDLKKIKESK